MKQDFLLVLALAASLPAQQIQYLNCTIPAETVASVIDWNGRPALLLVTTKKTQHFARFAAPFYWVGPKLELQVLQFAAFDYRSCAAASLVGLMDRDTAEPSLPMIAGALLFAGIGRGVPAVMDDAPNGYDAGSPRSWAANYCGQFCHTTCGTSGEGPQFAAVVCFPVIR